MINKVKLGDICDILNGYAFQSKKYVEKGIRIIRITNVQSGFIEDLDPKYYPVEMGKKIEKYTLYENDLLISLTGNVGRVALLTKEYLPAALNQRVACIRVKPGININIEYIYDALNNTNFENKCIASAKGIAQKNMSTEWLKDYEIILPELNMQVKIVKKIGELRKIIDIRRKQIESLDELIKARFVELFGDCRINENGFDCKKGSELFKFSSGKFLPEEKRLDEGTPVYGGNGIAWYTNEYLIDYPTIIIGRVGAQCGNIHAVTTPVWITDNAIYIKEQKTKAYTLEFLNELMRMMDFYQYADFSGQPKITQKPLETLDYIMPPIELQNEYTAFVKQTDKSKLELQKSLEEMQNLFDSLMAEYFG